MDKFESYEELEKYLRELPATWYPALIIEMVMSAYEKKVFVTGGASELVKSAEKRIGRNN